MSQNPSSPTNRTRIWTLVIVSLGLFMVVLDNLVVNVALPSIHRDLGASIQSLEWTVNAYVLAYAVLLLTGAALGDRFGRRRMFITGVSLFTASSAAAAIAPHDRLPDRRSGAAGHRRRDRDAADADAARRRVPAGATGRRTRRLVGDQRHRGGARTARRRRRRAGSLAGTGSSGSTSRSGSRSCRLPQRGSKESHGAPRSLDLPGVASGLERPVRDRLRAGSLAVAGLGEPRGDDRRWSPASCCVLAFVRHELRRAEPMLPMSFFAKRSFAVTNVVSLAMYFGMFGSIFFLSQFLQNVLGNTPLQAGLKLLVWTGATMVVAPLAGFFSSEFGSRRFMVAGLSLQAIALGWLATMASVDADLRHDDRPVRPRRRRHGAGVRAVRERGAPLGPHRPGRPGLGRDQRDPRARRHLRDRRPRDRVQRPGGYGSPQAFVDGLVPALWVGVGGARLRRADRRAAAVRQQSDRRGRGIRGARGDAEGPRVAA